MAGSRWWRSRAGWLVMFVIFSAIASGVVFAHYASLVHAADGIDHPVHVVALDVTLSSSGRGGTTARVTFADESGKTVEVDLPQLGHDRSDYVPPVRLVYERGSPGRAMLATDWSYAQTTRPRVSRYIALAVFAVDALIILTALVLGVRAMVSISRDQR
ncbi:MAG: hypothetical protein ACR2LX_06715 [Jatrophihabitans sp.]